MAEGGHSCGGHDGRGGRGRGRGRGRGYWREFHSRGRGRGRMDPDAVPLITLDDDSDDVTVSANPVIPPNTSVAILGVKPTPTVRVRAGANPGTPPDVPNTSLQPTLGVNPNPNVRKRAGANPGTPPDAPNKSLQPTLGVDPNPIVRGPAGRPACRPGYKPRGDMHRHHNLAAHSNRGRSNNRGHRSPSSRCQSSLEHPIPYVPLCNSEPEPDIPAADDPDDLRGVGVEEANTVLAPPGDSVALPEQTIAGPVLEPACGNNVILPPTEASVASDGVDDTSAPPADPYVALAATIQQPPNLPAEQPPNLAAQQPPNLPVQQPPNLPAQQPPNVPAQQPPNLPVQQSLNHPTQQPPNLPSDHKHLRALTEWFPTVDVDDLRDICNAFGPEVTFETLVTSLMQSQELPPHDDEAFHVVEDAAERYQGVEDDVERFRDILDEVASTPERRQQHKHAMYLSEMFPDMSVEDVEKRCAEFDPEESLEVMIEAFLASSDPAAVQSDVSYEEFFDDEGDAAPSILEQCIHHIAVFLPDIDVDEVRERCEDFGPNAAINDIVDSLIASHGGTDDDAGAAAAAVEDTEADLERLNAYQAVLNILPDADPDYLQERCESIGHDGEAWKRFVADALETKNYPTYEEYAEKQKTVKVQRKYREQFSVRDFVETHPEPVKHFREKVTSQDKSYMPHQKAYLMSRYPSTAEEEIDRVHAIMMFNLYNTCNELSKQEIPVKYPHKYNEYRECYAQVTSQELLEEIAFIENEVQILQYIAKNQEQQRREFEKARRNRELMTCNCCYDDALLLSAMTSCEDGHLFCKECVRRSAQLQIGMGKTAFPCLSDCGKNISWKALKEVLKPAVFNRVRQRQQLEEVQAANIRELEVCPFCDFGAIPLEGEIVFTCLNPECMIISCRLCKERNHIPLHCDELPEKDEQVKLRTYIEGRMTDALIRECWQCHKKFIKVDGCNKMTCTCGAIMCYLCRQPVKDYSHFNGQGADEPNLCPLWSNNEEIHDIAVQNEALKAKKEIEEKNPNVVLKHDPTVVLP